MSSGPDFLNDAVSYTVKEFYEKKRETLPQFVMVVQGYMGEILLETFGTNQILRIHTYSKQPRVIAKVTGGGKSKHKLLSIPLNFPGKLCVVKSSKKVGKEQSLREIMDNNKLPIDVQFGSDKVTIGAQVTNVSQISKLQLIETFEEMYLLGNCVNAGVLDARVVVVPLYLPDLQLALITGIKNKTEQEWKNYNEIMADQVETLVKFNKNYGNEDIAVYASESVQTDTMIAFVEPRLYANLHDIFPHMRKPADDVYANVDNVPGLSKSTNNTSPKTKKQEKEIESNATYKKLESTEYVNSVGCHQAMNNASEAVVCKLPPPVAPKPGTKPRITRPPPYSKPTNESHPPPVPGRSPLAHQSGNADNENVYSNDVPRAKVTPVAGQAIKPSEVPKPPPADFVSPEFPKDNQTSENNSSSVASGVSDKSSDRSSGGSTDEQPPINIESLTVEDLSYWMRRLKLDKYIDVFTENLIDGAILKEVDETLLRTEFSFSAIESIRLMKFVREGHVPKLGASKC